MRALAAVVLTALVTATGSVAVADTRNRDLVPEPTEQHYQLEADIAEAVAPHPEAAGLHRDDQGRFVVSVTAAGYDDVEALVRELAGDDPHFVVRQVAVSATALEEAMETLLANEQLFSDAGADITGVGLSAKANGLIVAVSGDRDAARDVTADLVGVPFTMAGPVAMETVPDISR